MRTAAVVLTTIIFFVSLPCHCQTGRGQTTCSVQACIDKIFLAINRGDVGKMEIIRLPSNLETRAAVSPEALERIYYTKLVIRDIAHIPWRGKMIEAFKGISVLPRGYIADLRWGLIFYSREDVRIGAIYFDRSGRYGAVNAVGASFEGGLFNWLDSMFSACP
jgi:hypothetical protein